MSSAKEERERKKEIHKSRHSAQKSAKDPGQSERQPSQPKTGSSAAHGPQLFSVPTSASSLSVLTAKSDSISIPKPSRLFYSYSAVPLSMDALYALDGIEPSPSLLHPLSATATATATRPGIASIDQSLSGDGDGDGHSEPDSAPSPTSSSQAAICRPKRLTKTHVHYLDHNISFLTSSKISAKPPPSSLSMGTAAKDEKTFLVVSQEFSSKAYAPHRQRAASLPSLSLGKAYIISELSRYKSLSLSSLQADEAFVLDAHSDSPCSRRARFALTAKRTRKHSASILDSRALGLQQLHPDEEKETTEAVLTSSIHDWMYSDKSLAQESPLWTAGHEKFQRLVLERSTIDMAALKSACWKGIPFCFRPIAWKLLIGYLPHHHKERHGLIVERKCIEYFQLAKSLGIYPEKKPGFDLALYHQITIDIPRTNPNMPLFKLPFIQQMLERILYCWSIRFPASGYVQGLNDLLTPLVLVFLAEVLQFPATLKPEPHFDMIQELVALSAENMAAASTAAYISLGPYRLAPEDLEIVEANSYFCFLKLLEKVQDRYTIGQTGLMKQLARLEELMLRVDAQLMRHFQGQNLDLYLFAYRWINCLLMRELPLHLTVRLWDTILSEGERGFSEFYLYVMAALLRSFSPHLQTLDFQDLILFLQHLPTESWTVHEIQMLTSEAYILKELFALPPLTRQK